MEWLKIAFFNKQALFTHADLTEQAVKDLSMTCKRRYNDWKDCKSANTLEACKEGYLDNYYACVGKLNAVRVELDTRERVAQKVN